MTIVASEIKLYYPLTVSNDVTNGGRISSNPVGNGNIFPNAQNSERVSGSTKYRKIFYKCENADNTVLSTPQFFLMGDTPGLDRIVCFPGTQTDTQNTMVATRLFGSGVTPADIAAGSSTITLVTESTDTLFAVNDPVIITDKTTIDSDAGNLEFFTVGSVNVTGTTVSLVTSNAYTLSFAYAAGSKVTSIINLPDINATVASVTNSSINGTFASGYIGLDATGGIEQMWTVSFTSSTAYTVVGDTLGLIGTGTKSTLFTASNSAFSGHNYFTLPSTCWGGTFVTNDRVTFTTHPSAQAIWLKRVIPQNCSLSTDNTFSFALIGNSDE